MEFVVAIGLSLLLTALSVLMHYETLRITGRLINAFPAIHRGRIGIGMAGVLIAHILSVLLYAFAYGVADGHLGTIAGKTEGYPLDPLYLSLMSFTTLGVGDIYPTGNLRLISGFQALNGFVLIGWSASFTYVATRMAWEPDPS
ncbi:ion channel [Pararhizobium haloflavum]|uniref:ion channel n=1 Tax=Pararhizobium haloflavum TaxID=2037914 RepID=UPI000C18ADEA|nr:ion channel [Pararhizobium haloflavum]